MNREETQKCGVSCKPRRRQHFQKVKCVKSHEEVKCKEVKNEYYVLLFLTSIPHIFSSMVVSASFIVYINI